jgi:hypothetical protein
MAVWTAGLLLARVDGVIERADVPNDRSGVIRVGLTG